MDLKLYLRQDFNKNIRHLFIKDRCEFCTSSDKLHLHHKYFFRNILDDVLDKLGLTLLDTEIYTREELQNRKAHMAREQIKCEYKTLCEKCQKNEHSRITNNPKRQKSKPKKINTLTDIHNTNRILKSFYENKMIYLTKKDRKPIVEAIGLIDGNRSNMKDDKIVLFSSITSLNEYLE